MPIFAPPPFAVPADVRRDLTDVHRRLARQYVTKAYDAMVELTRARFAPEFVDVRPGRPSMALLDFSNMRDEEMGHVARGVADGPLRWWTRLDGWSQRGGTLNVIAHHDVDGEWLKGGRRLPVHFASAVCETWVRRDGEWKALRFQELWLRGTMNGKPFKSGA